MQLPKRIRAAALINDPYTAGGIAGNSGVQTAHIQSPGAVHRQGTGGNGLNRHSAGKVQRRVDGHNFVQRRAIRKLQRGGGTVGQLQLPQRSAVQQQRHGPSLGHHQRAGTVAARHPVGAAAVNGIRARLQGQFRDRIGAEHHVGADG